MISLNGTDGDQKKPCRRTVIALMPVFNLEPVASADEDGAFEDLGVHDSVRLVRRVRA